jgi:hypothetical protein
MSTGLTSGYELGYTGRVSLRPSCLSLSATLSGDVVTATILKGGEVENRLARRFTGRVPLRDADL